MGVGGGGGGFGVAEFGTEMLFCYGMHSLRTPRYFLEFFATPHLPSMLLNWHVLHITTFLCALRQPSFLQNLQPRMIHYFHASVTWPSHKNHALEYITEKTKNMTESGTGLCMAICHL